MEIKDRHCYGAYLDMKRRKNESRTYFLDKLCERLNLRMKRDDYGSQLLKSFSKDLTAEFGKGLSVLSLYNYRSFYLTFYEIFFTPWRILTWSHYK